MSRFILKTFLLILGLPILLFVLFSSLDFYLNAKNARNSLFIWGDSQAYQGIDLEELKSKTNKTIYTAAVHGSGVYDFLVFVEKVPENSDVLIAISKLTQLRRKELDRNSSGISLLALTTLLNNNYSWNEVLQILNTNRTPKSIFQSSTTLYGEKEQIVLHSPLESYRSRFKTAPSFLIDKQNIIAEGIKSLKRKKCTIYLIDFPYHKLLTEVENNTPVKKLTDTFFEKMIREAGCIKLDTLILSMEKQVMYDLTHLNSNGARQVSAFIGEQIKKHESKAFVIVNGNDSTIHHGL